MPDYTDTPGYKPPEKAFHDALAKDHEKKQDVRRAAAERHAKAHENPAPVERMYGQDRFINTDPGSKRPRQRLDERSKPRQELTKPQQEMRARREAARAADLEQVETRYSDKKYSEIPKNVQTPNR